MYLWAMLLLIKAARDAFLSTSKRDSGEVREWPMSGGQ